MMVSLTYFNFALKAVVSCGVRVLCYFRAFEVLTLMSSAPEMGGDSPDRNHLSPDATLSAIRAYDGPLLIDLDETLYLRNSTEDFIDCARPGLLALLLLRMFDIIKPWRWTGRDTRDNWRVCAISILFPWTRRRWRTQAPYLAARYTNQQLKGAIDAHPKQPIILTTGFSSIVTPLLAAMGFADATIIAARMYPFTDRRDGKLHMASRALGMGTIGRCLAVTDSMDDIELLEKCARPLRTVWPQARYRLALSAVYLPGQYISQIKRPGERYILRGIFLEDFAFWLLSSIGLAIDPASHIAGLLLLLISFWAIYERGYVDNDQLASRYEVDPTLSPNFGKVEVVTPPVQPWIWALLVGAAANIILQPQPANFIAHYGLWILALISTYGCFLIYNRIDKMSRIWLYPFLQLGRATAFAVVVPIEVVGAVALGAHVLSRWMPYQIYRLTPTKWPKMGPALMRLISFMLLIALIACALGPIALATWSLLALLLWNMVRARYDIIAVFRSARRIDRPVPDPTGAGGFVIPRPDQQKAKQA
jgi:hypothetical protein